MPEKNKYKIVSLDEKKNLISPKTIYIGAVIAIVILVLFIALNTNKFKLPSFKTTPQVSVQPTSPLKFSLPPDWTAIKENLRANQILKLERKTKTNVKPIITVLKSETQQKNYDAYISSLINGARTTIRGFSVIKKTQKTENGYTVFIIESSYIKTSKKINAIQHFYFKKSHVITITASYDPSEPKTLYTELKQVIDLIFDQYIRELY